MEQAPPIIFFCVLGLTAFLLTGYYWYQRKNDLSLIRKGVIRNTSDLVRFLRACKNRGLEGWRVYAYLAEKPGASGNGPEQEPKYNLVIKLVGDYLVIDSEDWAYIGKEHADFTSRQKSLVPFFVKPFKNRPEIIDFFRDDGTLFCSVSLKVTSK